MSLSNHLARIQQLLPTKAPRVEASLRPAATAEDLQRLAQSFGGTLPADLESWFRWHDGQNGSSALHPGRNETAHSIGSALHTQALLSGIHADGQEEAVGSVNGWRPGSYCGLILSVNREMLMFLSLLMSASASITLTDRLCMRGWIEWDAQHPLITTVQEEDGTTTEAPPLVDDPTTARKRREIVGSDKQAGIGVIVAGVGGGIMLSSAFLFVPTIVNGGVTSNDAEHGALGALIGGVLLVGAGALTFEVGEMVLLHGIYTGTSLLVEEGAEIKTWPLYTALGLVCGGVAVPLTVSLVFANTAVGGLGTTAFWVLGPTTSLLALGFSIYQWRLMHTAIHENGFAMLPTIGTDGQQPVLGLVGRW